MHENFVAVIVTIYVNTFKLKDKLPVFSLVPIFKEWKVVYEITMSAVFPSFQFMNQLTDFHETRYQCFAYIGRSNFVPLIPHTEK
jgi:hypothetical protein